MNETSSATLSRSNGPQLSHEEITRRAQELWEKYGRPAGRDEEIWYEAERGLQATGSSGTASAGFSKSSSEKPVDTVAPATTTATRGSERNGGRSPGPARNSPAPRGARSPGK